MLKTICSANTAEDLELEIEQQRDNAATSTSRGPDRVISFNWSLNFNCKANYRNIESEKYLSS